MSAIADYVSRLFFVPHQRVRIEKQTKKKNRAGGGETNFNKKETKKKATTDEDGRDARGIPRLLLGHFFFVCVCRSFFWVFCAFVGLTFHVDRRLICIMALFNSLRCANDAGESVILVGTPTLCGQLLLLWLRFCGRSTRNSAQQLAAPSIAKKTNRNSVTIRASGRFRHASSCFP